MKRIKVKTFYADNAYTGQKQEEIIGKFKLVNRVHEKGYRGNPLTEEQKANNTEKSKTRARVEHLFWLYGAKHEWFNFKINWNKKSNGNNRTHKFDLQSI